VGLDVGAYIVQCFAELGRADLRCLAANRALLTLEGTRIGLQHPAGAGGENIETSLYRFLRRQPGWGTLDLFVCGHWHRYGYAWRNGVECVSVPCWESSSPWGQGLPGDVDTGGVIVELDGRDFRLHRRLY
jgi:hypothetical protein